MSSPAPDAAAGGAVPSVPSSVSGGLASMYSASELAALSLHTTAWRSEAWLHAYPLHRGTVLDYFKHTDFYDRTCNNEIVNMQQQGAEDTSKALSLMEGIEYSVDPSSTDDLFLIRKVWRLGPGSSSVGDSSSNTQLLALYVVIGVEGVAGDPTMPPRGSVFPLPDALSVWRTNLSTASLYLAEAFEGMQKHAKEHPAVRGYQWDFSAPAADAAAAATQEGAEGEHKDITVVPHDQPRNPYCNLIDQALVKLAQNHMQR